MFGNYTLIVRFSRFLGPIVILMLVAVAFAIPATAVYADRDPRPAKNYQAKGASDVYIVQMAESPVVAYEGGIAGLAPTAPAPGGKVRTNSANVQRYVAHLNSRHDAVLNAVGALSSKLYDYQFSFNGFAAVLTPAQVAKIASMQGVLSVEVDVLAKPDTDNTPRFLGLTGSGDLWSKLGGQASAGEDVIIGILDTGIWPEHPSFSGAGFGPHLPVGPESASPVSSSRSRTATTS